jgi:hypothetical protein
METQGGLFVASSKGKLPAKEHTFTDDDSKTRIFTDHDNSAELECCNKCQAMTGTIEGLTALLDVDGDGYEYYNWQEIQDAWYGPNCALCEHVLDISEDTWGDEADGDSITNDRIRIHAEVNIVNTFERQKHSPSHPLAGRQLGGLRFRIPSNSNSSNATRVAPDARDKIFSLVTFEGIIPEAKARPFIY